MASLAESDLRALMSVLDEGRQDEPGPILPWATLHRLASLVGCDELLVNDLEPSRCRIVVEQRYGSGDHSVAYNEFDDPDDPFWHYYWDGSCSYHERTGATYPIRMSDYHDTAALLRGLPALVEASDRMRHCVVLPLPLGPGLSRKLCLKRYSGHDFSDRDVLILELLRPHLHDVFLDARRRRGGIPRLTRREREVLELAAGGCSNRDIADQLVISVSTVRKHLEHVFDRTGTHTRVAAAAAALPQEALKAKVPALVRTGERSR